MKIKFILWFVTCMTCWNKPNSVLIYLNMVRFDVLPIIAYLSQPVWLFELQCYVFSCRMYQTSMYLWLILVVVVCNVNTTTARIVKERFYKGPLIDSPEAAFLDVSMETAFKCALGCAHNIDCDIYSYDSTKCICYMYQQGRTPAVYKSQGGGSAFHKGRVYQGKWVNDKCHCTLIILTSFIM